MKLEHKARLQAERAKCARLRLRLAKLEDTHNHTSGSKILYALVIAALEWVMTVRR